MRLLVSEGFLNKNTKAMRPDPESGKWRGAKTKGGQFGTKKPLYSNTIKINNIEHELQVWTFNNKWGKQVLFFKLFKVKDESDLESTM